MILANAWIVAMDDAGTEHERGWLRIEDGRVAELGPGDPPEAGEDLRGAVVTPGLVNTHHHLYQTLTRARAQQANLFEWLRELYPVWAGIDAEMEYAAARTGLAELALSGCTIEAPFQLLAFLALSVIPSLKITDRGLVDVDRFELVPLRA